MHLFDSRCEYHLNMLTHRKFPIFFIDASSVGTLTTTYQQIAEHCKAGTSVDSAIRYFRALETPWLLILDNADDPSFNLGAFIPISKYSNVIITSRNEQVRAHASSGAILHLPDLEPKDAVTLLLRQADLVESAETCAIALGIVQELGYLALAVSAAGSYIAQWCALPDYIALFKKHRRDMLGPQSHQRSEDYNRSVRAIWDLTFAKLNEPCRQLVQVCSFLHYTSISEDIFSRAAKLGAEIELLEGEEHPRQDLHRGMKGYIRDFFAHFLDDSGLWDGYFFRETLSELQKHSLIQYNRDTRTISFHPLIHACAFDSHSSDTVDELRLVAMEIVCRSMPVTISAQDHAFRRFLFVHAKHLLSSYGEKEFSSDLTYFTSLRLADIIEENGDYNSAVKLRLCCFKICRNVFGVSEDRPEILTSMQNLALTYGSQGRFEDAEKLGASVLATRQRVLGEEHPDTLSSMNDLAWTFKLLGRFEEAEKLGTTELAISLRVLGEEHPGTLASMSQLASTKASLGRFKDAERLDASVLECSTSIITCEYL